MTGQRRDSMAQLPDMNPGPVCRISTDGTIELANAAARKIFQDEKLVGKSWPDKCPDLSELMWERVLSGAESLQHEARINDSYLVFTLVHQPDSNNVFVYGTDITDRKKAERALEDHAVEREQMAQLPEMNPGPVCRLDLQGTVQLANAAAREAFGANDLVGRTWADLCPDMPSDVWESVLSGKTAPHHETQIHGKHLMFTLAHRPGMEFVFVYGSDITERKQAEEDLAKHAQERAEMARFPEMNPGLVVRLNRDGDVLLGNRAARELFDDEELVGKCWVDLCPGMDKASWNRIVNAKNFMRHETQIAARHFMFTHTPGAGEQNIFVYGVDLSELKSAERALQQSEKMATLGTLAAGVAHELNNPAAAAQRGAEQLSAAFADMQQAQLRLSQIDLSESETKALMSLDQNAKVQAECGCDLDALTRSDREAEIETWLEDRGVEDAWELAPALVSMNYDVEMLEALPADFNADAVPTVLTWLSRTYPVYSLLQEIGHGAGRISEIVTALKAYSYLGQAPIKAVNVNEGLKHTLIILRSKLKAGITVEQDLATDLPEIQAYGSELNQVWTNLLDNAAGAMGGQGTIRMRTYRDGSTVVIEISDNGPGIPEDIQPKIFDAFFTTKAPGEGTGLGLHTSYNIIVQKHGGTIEIHSKPGDTRFEIRLPIEAAPQSAPAEIDDNPDHSDALVEETT